MITIFLKLTNTIQRHPIITKYSLMPSDTQKSRITDNFHITYFF